ncbi:unnamed protein product [Microthlaspi erraticum]|uniref:DUF7769 domain-containing protein n=1 Tax=Microthlaspi erraticum TaxID=1685480 RepID=A0A6D2JVH0_9BRAS|nr:unnamed protein product [Microthlaspi erraticum]CAA7040042.1 unnamed protein product [Microthlaspi erraticum]
MTDAERWEVYRALLQRSNNGVLKRGTTKEVANLLAVPKQSVQKIWRRAKDNVSNGEAVDVSHRRKGKCGRKPKEIDLEQIFNIPLHCRTTMRSIAVVLEVSPSTIHRYVKHGLVRRHSNAIKPTLKDDNKKARVKFCLSMLDKNTFSHQPKFVDMFNIIHIDEKWFYMTKKSTTYYLHPLEEDPVRSCQSKNFIGKVMFLAAMARPRFDEEGNEIFSGKIGMFPFVTMQEAQRRSRNREAGTMELKPMDSIKREDIKRCLIEKVLPNIRERWPTEDFGKTIFIQQDNARTHVDVNNEEFQEAASQHGFDIRLMCQPPNSPYMNILDLGFFRAIQSLQHKVCPTTVEQLVHAVEEAYDEYPPKQVNKIFLTLQSCLLETMKIGGANTYKIPHMKKDRLEREGRLPIQLACDPILVQEVISSLAC